MYRTITYRSKALKNKTIFIYDSPEEAADVSVASSAESEKTEKPVKAEKKKKRKEKSEEVTYIIDGVEVREEDLTEDERADLRSEALLNTDGFYTPLKPLDYEEPEEEETETKSSNKKMIGMIAVIAVAVIMVAGVIVAMKMLL